MGTEQAYAARMAHMALAMRAHTGVASGLTSLAGFRRVLQAPFPQV